MIEANMGGAIEHWLGFQDKIGRSFMLNEDALKYPISDYLVNEGSINLKSIYLERPHPNFSNKLVDLSIFDDTIKKLNNVFEFKLAKTATRSLTERQRIFNDIIRLHLATSVADNKCYFIITGKSTNFERDFKNYQVGGSEFFKKWFAFTKDKAQSFNVASETDINYKTIYQAFLNKYSPGYQGTLTTLKLPDKITTRCEFVTAFKKSFVPYMAGIWSVT